MLSALIPSDTATRRCPWRDNRNTGGPPIPVHRVRGGETLEHCIDALRKGGRVAYPNGIEPEPKRRRGIKTKPYDGVPGREEFERLSRAIEAARLQVPIAAEFALADAVRAHERLAQGHILGKIVLRVR